ncbi:peptidoglycan recognition protein family protein [Actinoplanes sp. CA-252034]|uniref:peptidoglycan recognition protein family protein n=1 Tax=Actinoplanes sp. CA-252034 TaxID=3239906 RepID=UPI003D98A475
MPRLTWLADELRRAGLRVVEVDGWKTRGNAEFQPVGMTWHATAGSRKSTAQGEVHVILTGSNTAPAPIAQLMIYRDGVVYVCAAGRCNHNKIGWAGPNKGLGNTQLLGIEMANDNKGEPWPTAQLDAARRATAAIMRRLGADPLRRLAAHYEHQPYVGRPPGEGSTKSDPYGVDMTKERPRVAALMEENELNADDRKWLSAEIAKLVDARVDQVAADVLEGRRFAWSEDSKGGYQRNLGDLVGDPWALIMKGKTRGGDPIPSAGVFGQILSALTTIRDELKALTAKK